MCGGYTEYHHIVLVTDGVPHAVLWGVDKLIKEGIVLNFKKRHMKLGDGTKILIAARNDYRESGRNVESISIPSSHGIVVWVTAPKATAKHDKREWVVEAVKGNNLIIASATVQDEDNIGMVLVQVLNLTTKILNIPEMQSLVKFAHLEETTTIDLPDLVLDKPISDKEISKIVEETKLTKDQKTALHEFLIKHRKVFSEPLVLGKANVPLHEIKTICSAHEEAQSCRKFGSSKASTKHVAEKSNTTFHQSMEFANSTGSKKGRVMTVLCGL